MLLIKRAFAPAILGMLFLFAGSAVAFAQAPTPPTPSPQPAPGTSVQPGVTILGQVTNGTPGGSLPVTTTVTLYAVDGQAVAFKLDGTADAAGKVRFDNVAYQPGRAYALTGVVGGVPYYGRLVQAKAGDQALVVPLSIYDTTTDAGKVRVEQVYVVAQFPSASQVQVINAFILSNDGDRTVSGAEKTPGGQPGTLRFYLPAGAQNVEFQDDDGEKFVRTEDGFLTTWAIPPGAGSVQVAVRYTLPYAGQIHLETRSKYPVQQVNVLLPEQGISLTGASLANQGTQTLQDGSARRVYSGDGFAAGQTLAFDLSGTPVIAAPLAAQPVPVPPAAVAPAFPAGVPLDQRAAGIAAVAAGVLMILAAGVWHFHRLRHQNDDPALAEHAMLVEALADLDEDHEAGKIGDQDYAEQRQLLKAVLLAAIQEPAEAEPVEVPA